MVRVPMVVMALAAIFAPRAAAQECTRVRLPDGQFTVGVF